MIHELKIWSEFYTAILNHNKRFELRETKDRSFKVGDLLFLKEYDEGNKLYSGRSCYVIVLYVLNITVNECIDVRYFRPKEAAILSISNPYNVKP